MGYYTKHIIRILAEEQATKENYISLMNVMWKNKGYTVLHFHDNLLDDSNWNGGNGSKWYEIDETVEALTKTFPNLEIRIDCLPEGAMYNPDDPDYDPSYTYSIKNGKSDAVYDIDEVWFNSMYGKNTSDDTKIDVLNMYYDEYLAKALEIATNAHKGQKDNGGHDYIDHPKRVADRCKDKDAKIVALLHDTIENTDVTEEYLLEQGFAQSLVEAVVALTPKKGETYPDFIDRVNKNHLAKIVKIADLEDNMDITRLTCVSAENDFFRLDKYLKSWRFLKGFEKDTNMMRCAFPGCPRGKRGRLGGVPGYVRAQSDRYVTIIDEPYERDDIASAYEQGFMEGNNFDEAKLTLDDHGVLKSINGVLFEMKELGHGEKVCSGCDLQNAFFSLDCHCMLDLEPDNCMCYRVHNDRVRGPIGKAVVWKAVKNQEIIDE